jgi:hypothetical protein
LQSLAEYRAGIDIDRRYVSIVITKGDKFMNSFAWKCFPAKAIGADEESRERALEIISWVASVLKLAPLSDVRIVKYNVGNIRRSMGDIVDKISVGIWAKLKIRPNMVLYEDIVKTVWKGKGKTSKEKILKIIKGMFVELNFSQDSFYFAYIATQIDRGE